ncbi:hypothetical protein AXF42_Ash000901 [Apostasia shenzhenica]|uniref:Nonsense-mediated mRNA decay factor SMG8 n=1 Tax=Apostasia shenzhenica TaxID=1088818 RepID=A0A2I0ATD5_9ASPA|nr:hypothetical protein AXF42_Ash000901 [Apostasia shenzhenica]
MRSQVSPFFHTKSSSISQPSSLRASSISPPNKTGGSSSRHGSSISRMSGTTSHPSMLPGQCIPVVLFVFEDDFSNASSSATNADDISEVPSRQNLTLKGSGSVVMLARPPNKAEGSFRKRLHSSLETQIRFLIKKGRVLIGTDHSHFGSRGIGNVNSLPLFSLDTSRVVSLLDRSTHRRCEPLNFVTSLIEEAISSKTKIDFVMLEKRCQNLINEDMQSIKYFVFRQADMLRGRGGLLSNNANSVSAAGVGMVAAAAAAAAASAAAGKLMNAPELPSLENWLASTNQILDALLSVDRDFINLGNIKRLSVKKTAIEMRDVHAVEDAVSFLESSKNLNMRFSVCRCEKALPLSKEVYLEGLPACYPTSMHKAQLENALRAFHSMVRGQAVKLFAKKLVDDCTSIWKAGRQLCDAVSLTGKPCMHPQHDVGDGNVSQDIVKQHSSGYVFLHACACGRLRRVRSDPFDFESANTAFNIFTNCDDVLPALFLPKVSNGAPTPCSSWSVLRVGGANYYEPSNGLLQPGFCSTQKVLLKWAISIEKKVEANDSPIGVIRKGSVVSLSSGLKIVSGMGEGTQRSTDAKIHIENHPVASESQKKVPELVSSNSTSISFGRGLPSFSMKKPFAEVVAGNATTDSTISVQLRKPKKDGADKSARTVTTPNQNHVSKSINDFQEASHRAEHVPPLESSISPETNYQTNDNPYLQIGTNIVPVNPVNMYSIGDLKAAHYMELVTVYVGFEHECPCGHRFLLSPEHLTELDSSYSGTHEPESSTGDSEGTYGESKVKGHGKIDDNSSKKVSAVTNMRKDKFCEPAADVSQGHEGFTFFPKPEKLPSGHRQAMLSDSVHQIEGKLTRAKLDDDSSAFFLLNRNLPLYMNCPHCCKLTNQIEKKTKFASKISQLQRIFLVTPPFPTVLAACPVIQFEESCLPPSTPDREHQSHFSIGCQIILPPESFLTVRLPFIYGVHKDDGSLQPLCPLEHKPENTAWLVKGTTLQLVSVGHEPMEEFQIQ